MRKLPFIIGILIVFLLIKNSYASEFTEYDKSIWKDMCFLTPPNNLYGDTYQFFSFAFMNESKYLVFWATKFDTTLVFNVLRYNEFCSLEASTGGIPTGNSYAGWDKVIFGNNILFYKNKLILPFGMEYRAMPSTNIVNFVVFDINEYLSGGNPFNVPILAVKWASDIDKNLITVSSLALNKSYYSDMACNTTFAIGYKYGGRYYIQYDFYDLDSGSTGGGKTIDFSVDLSDVKKFYIIPTYGRCFQWNDCLFHVLFEGRSAQNNNRYGIYVREIHYNPRWNEYEFVDRGIIGFNESTGFANNQIPGIIDWYYTCHYPKFCDKIFIRLNQDNKLMLAVLTFSYPHYIITREQIINYYDNNVLVSYANGIYSGSYTGSTTYHQEIYNVRLGNINNKTYINGFLINPSQLGYGCRLNISLLKGSSNIYTLVIDSSDDVIFDYSHPEYGGIFYREINLPAYNELYNISVDIYCSPSYGISYKFYFDVIGSKSDFKYTLSPTGVEAFSVFPIGEGINYLILQFPTPSYCSCSEWYYQGCYNSTHEYWTRACTPTGCSNEIKFNYNSTCATIAPTTTTIYPYPTTTTIPLNLTAPTGSLVLIPLLLGNPLFFAIVFGLALAASIEKKVNSGGKAFILTFLGVLVMFSVFGGIVPLWLVLVLIVIVIGGIVYFRRGS